MTTTTTLTRGFDRRVLLKATGIVGLAVGGLAYAPTAARALAGSPRIDLTSPNQTLFEHKVLHHTTMVTKSLAFDNANARLFVLQAQGGAAGDLCLNQVSFSGAVLGTMHVKGSGRGLSFGVESVGTDSYIWMEGARAASGGATALTRFKWVAGAVPTGAQTFFPGSSEISCAIDPICKRLLVRKLESSGYVHHVYELPFGQPTQMKKLSDFTLPVAVTNLGALRGYAPYGKYLYLYTGSPQRDAKKANSRITVLDMDTREVLSSTVTFAGRALPYRAPKGLAIYATPAGTVGLYFGLASRDTYDGSAAFANIYVKDDAIPGKGVITNAAGATLRTVDGTDISRNANALVRYTRTSTQTVTPTNQYGVEVTVSTSTNKVTALNNRLASGSTAGTAIPAGSYVLSGHGWGAGMAGQWLLDFATVGKLVTLNAAGPAPGPDPDPEPGPDPDPQPVEGALAASVVSVWHHSWSGPQPWTGYPAGAKAQVNHIVLGLAQSGGSGTGKLVYYNRFGAGLATGISAAKAAGCTVAMGFGGSSDGGISITNSSQADQAYDSVVGFVNTFGINGIDVDLEPSGSSWTQDALVRLCTRLKTTYGSDFIVGVTPGLYGDHTAKWMSLAKALGSNFDYMAPMLYDFPEANQSNYGAVCINKCDIMAAAGIPQSKMILGFMCKPPSENYPNSSDSWQKTRDAYNAVTAKYPNLRGAFIWEDKIMVARSWDWTNNMGAVIKG